MKEEMKKYWSGIALGTKKMFKEFFKKETNKKQRANMLTFTRLIIPIITIICSIIGLICNIVPLLIVSGFITCLGAVTDFFDGRCSRKHNSVSEYGKTLDQLSDKVFAGFIGINLLFINFNYIYILLGEAIISIVNIYYKIKYKNLDINSTKVGKIKEFPLFFTLALGYLSNINNLLNIISNISILITFITQLLTSYSYVISNNNEIKKNINNVRENTNEQIEVIKNDKEKVKIMDKNINNNTKIEKINNIKNKYYDLKNFIIENKEEKLENNNQYYKK